MKKSLHLAILIFSILVSISSIRANSINKKNFFEIKTNFGSFPLSIPDLNLPEYKKYPLIKVKNSNLPDLPDWNYPRFIPDNPSWLDNAGKFYKEGIENLFLGKLKIAIKRFQKVIDEYPETNWYFLSWFWHGQTLAKQRKFTKAEESIIFFLNLLKKEKNFDYFTEYKDLGIYSIVWLTLKQRKYEESLSLIKKYESEVRVKKLQNQFYFLKYYAFKKLNKSNKLIFNLHISGIKKFPYNFDHFVYLAKFLYKIKRWKDLSDLVSDQISLSKFYNEKNMEYFIWLGLVAEMELKKWNKVRKKLIFLEKLGVRNPDILSLAYFRLYSEEKDFFNAWNSWTEIDDNIIRELSLRELMHLAIINEDFNFLQKKLNSLKTVGRFWRSWQEEMELIYAYLYLCLGQRKKSKQWLKWSLNNLRKKGTYKSTSIINEEIIFLKAVIELISYEYKKAFLNVKNLLEKFPSSKRLSDYYFWYGVMLYEMEKKHLESIMAMRQVSRGGERDDDRLYILGKINYDQKKWRSAILSFNSLKNKYPKSIFIEDSLFFQAESFYEQKRYNLGLETINDLESRYTPLKNTLRVIILKVRILMALKKYEQADDVLRRRIARNKDLSLIKLRVEVLKYIKDPKRILTVTGEGLGISTSEDEGFLYFHRANALYDMKKFSEADAYYNLAIKNHPEGKKRIINFRILKIQYILGRFQELLIGVEKFLKDNNKDNFANEILYLIGNYFLDKDKREKAKPYLKKLIENYKNSVSKVDLSPEKRVEQIILIGKLYKSLNEFNMAERWLNQALKSVETIEKGKKKLQLSILREKGEVLYNLGKHPQSLAASLKVLYLDNTISEKELYNLNLRIASSYKNLGRLKESEAIYRKVLKNIETDNKRIEVEKLLKKLSK